jgi:hypothetical protein
MIFPTSFQHLLVKQHRQSEVSRKMGRGGQHFQTLPKSLPNHFRGRNDAWVPIPPFDWRARKVTGSDFWLRHHFLRGSHFLNRHFPRPSRAGFAPPHKNRPACSPLLYPPPGEAPQEPSFARRPVASCGPVASFVPANERESSTNLPSLSPPLLSSRGDPSTILTVV